MLLMMFLVLLFLVSPVRSILVERLAALLLNAPAPRPLQRNDEALPASLPVGSGQPVKCTAKGVRRLMIVQVPPSNIML